MSDLTPENPDALLPTDPRERSGRDRRGLLRHAFVWLPAGLWTGALLVGLRAAVEVAARHRTVGTASAEEAGIFLWETVRGLPALAWGAALAGPLVAALAFRFGRTPRSRAVVTVLGTGVATAGLAAQAWSREQLGWRAELALDAPIVFVVAVLLLVVFTVRVVEAGARFAGPLEDAPALLRPLLGGGATAGGFLVLGLALGLPPGLATPPQRIVTLPLRDLLLEPETAAARLPLTPASTAGGPSEPRRALRRSPPAAVRFAVAENASHLVAEFAVDGEARRALDPSLTAPAELSLRCDVLLDGAVATREELRLAPVGELGTSGPDLNSWRAIGGAEGVPLAGAREVELRLELVGPRDPEFAGSAPGAWVGFAPLVQVQRRETRFAAPTRARPSLVVVRLPTGIEPPASAWKIDLQGGDFREELPALAVELLRTGTATAALGPRAPGRRDGFETRLATPAALERWLESRVGVRSFLWLDLTDPIVTTRNVGAGVLFEELRRTFAAHSETIWVFLVGDGSTARVGDFRHARGLVDATLTSAALRDALVARTQGVAPSVAAAWERASGTEDSAR